MTRSHNTTFSTPCQLFIKILYNSLNPILFNSFFPYHSIFLLKYYIHLHFKAKKGVT